MVTGTHGKTTTTSMLIVSLQRVRSRPVVRGRRRPGRARNQCPPRQRRVRRRGRRERRFAAGVPRRRGGDQRRGRSPGLLRHSSRLRRGVRRVRQHRPGRCACRLRRRPWLGNTGRPALRRWGSGLALRLWEDGPPLAGTLLSWEQQGAGAVAHVDWGAKSTRGYAALGARPAYGAQCTGCVGGGGRGGRATQTWWCWTGLPDSRASVGVLSWWARSQGCGSSTPAHHPTE